MKWNNPKEQLPEFTDYDGYLFSSVLVLVKDQRGNKYTAELKQFYDDFDNDYGRMYWEQYGRDAYTVDFEDIVGWMELPE